MESGGDYWADISQFLRFAWEFGFRFPSASRVGQTGGAWGRFNIIKRFFYDDKNFRGAIKKLPDHISCLFMFGLTSGLSLLPYELLGTLYLHKFIHRRYIEYEGYIALSLLEIAVAPGKNAYGFPRVVGTIELSDGPTSRDAWRLIIRLFLHKHENLNGDDQL